MPRRDPPPIHGDDHAPGGPDPIRGLNVRYFTSNPGVYVYRSTSGTVNNATLTDLNTLWNATVGDFLPYLETDTGPTAIRVHSDCIVYFMLVIVWSSAFAGDRRLELTCTDGIVFPPRTSGVLRGSTASAGQYDLLEGIVEVTVTSDPAILVPKVIQSSGSSQDFTNDSMFRVRLFSV